MTITIIVINAVVIIIIVVLIVFTPRDSPGPHESPLVSLNCASCFTHS